MLKEPYSAELARLIVREMTELLVLDMVRKYVVTKKLTLTIGYDRTSLELVRRGKTPKEDVYRTTTTKTVYEGKVSIRKKKELSATTPFFMLPYVLFSIF